MPATEQTWRNTKQLHVIFAVSSVILLVSTICMLVADHYRSWKPYQRNSVELDTRMTGWQEEQYLTGEAIEKHEMLGAEVAEARSKPIPAELHAEFKALMAANEETKDFDTSSLDAEFEQLQALAATATEKRTAAVEARKKEQEAEQAAVQAELALQEARRTGSEAAKIEELGNQATQLQAAAKAAREATRIAETELAAAQDAAAQQRDVYLASLDAIIRRARVREDYWLGERKFVAAKYDAVKASLGLAVRDERPEAVLAELQGQVDGFQNKIDELTLTYQQAATFRTELQNVVRQMTAEADEARKALNDSLADLERLRTQVAEKSQTWVDGYWLGKNWLTLPIVDAFNSPLRIDNQWVQGLTVDYNFKRVTRFDRCMTCHVGIEKPQKGKPSDPFFQSEHVVTLDLVRPNADELPPQPIDAQGKPQPHNLYTIYGLKLAESGPLNANDVAVKYVHPRSAAAQASPVSTEPPRDAEALMREARSAASAELKTAEPHGLMVGDVVIAVEGASIYARDQLERNLLLVPAGKPVRLEVRRGLPHPYTTHPRLDLYVGSLSPHKRSEFGCTVCHEGQGSATSFNWASHTPTDPAQRERWKIEHGWFDNVHWIYPMYPARFAESTCLKCHHGVTELDSSERFAGAPAPKAIAGYHLIRKMACYGCHEINGYDGTRRIGPDLRLEPNYFAGALELIDRIGPEDESPTAVRARQLARIVAGDPETPAARHELLALLKRDEKAEEPALPASAHTLTAVLADVETPGELRKSGPSLRFTASKLDKAFLVDWLKDPTHFRPTTRMPKFFGNWAHLHDDEKADLPPGEKPKMSSLEKAKAFEPIEILGITEYLLSKSQAYEYGKSAVSEEAGASDEANAAQLARGRRLFQTQGCLACHQHSEFADAEPFRRPGEIVQGPDLSGISAKFDTARNPHGREWLYSWIKNPSIYHARTFMPKVILDPVEVDGEMTDPIADITAFLMAVPNTAWAPPSASQLAANETHLNELMAEHLNKAFFELQAAEYGAYGIPERRRADLKGPERELLVPNEAYTSKQGLSTQQKLVYIGSKSISKYGCYGCHDIPGFEDAKPIGTGLNDWGRKDPAKLAFEHIDQYLEHMHSGHGNGHASHGEHEAEGAHADDAHHAAEPSEVLPAFYEHALHARHREGFAYQKLAAPRSYDYHVTANKPYNDWLRMPKFKLTPEQREEVITFVLGLVADPPSEEFVYTPDERTRAVLEGQRVLEKFNCGGCHVLEAEEWTLTFPPEYFGSQGDNPKVYPFVPHHFASATLAESEQVDDRGYRRAKIRGLPAVDDNGAPVVQDASEIQGNQPGDPLFEDTLYQPNQVQYAFDLFEPAAIDGHGYQVGVLPLYIRETLIEKKQPATGGFLMRYLLEPVTAYERQVNANAKGTEARAWLPPVLLGEGRKVNPEWLYEFLLDPHPIRPAVELQMPKFNMSPADATKLVRYFAARDGILSPFELEQRQRPEYVRAENREYLKALEEAGRLAGVPQDELHTARFDDAMQIVVNGNYCIKCHAVADFDPSKRAREKAPNLAIAGDRLRPEYLRKWIARPTSILPYTAMPVNIEYDPNLPHLGGVSQDLYTGTSVEQVDSLVDLLVNFHRYNQEKTNVGRLVQEAEAANPVPAENGEPPAAGGAETGAAPVPMPEGAAAAPVP